MLLAPGGAAVAARGFPPGAAIRGQLGLAEPPAKLLALRLPCGMRGARGEESRGEAE